MIIFAVGSTDRLFYRLHISYTAQIHFWRVGVWILPIAVFYIVRSAARALQRSDAHPLLGWDGDVVRRSSDGAVRRLSVGGPPPAGSPDPPSSTPPE